MKEVLETFFFHKDCIKWIMAMVLGVFFSILLNNSPSQTLNPSRGIRQGDPISPFLFVIMVESLSRSITMNSSREDLFGLKLYDFVCPSTHEQFVDDTLLMVTTTLKQALSFKAILSEFSEASGTSINMEKSKLFFLNTPLSIQRNIARIMDSHICNFPSKYLGASLTDKPLARSNWEDLITKLEKGLANWTFHTLNLAGRLVFIKYVFPSIPHYMYLALAASKSVSCTIRNIHRSFLSRGSENKRKWVLVTWDRVCKPKKMGGLGLRDP